MDEAEAEEARFWADLSFETFRQVVGIYDDCDALETPAPHRDGGASG
jgi:hypothetical protein